MRFYLDSAQVEDIRSASRHLFVAGVTTNPELLQRARISRLRNLFDAVAATGRRDWKFWLQLPQGSATEILERASAATKALVERTGGRLAGPTLVFKILPDGPGLEAATRLIRDGAEVCLTAIVNPGQALAVSALPEIAKADADPLETEGPPASRNPHMPHALACYVGRLDDAGRDGVRTVVKMNDALVANQRRSRILAASIRDRDRLDTLIRRLARRSQNVVDVTLGFDLLTSLIKDELTDAALHQFAKYSEFEL